MLLGSRKRKEGHRCIWLLDVPIGCASGGSNNEAQNKFLEVGIGIRVRLLLCQLSSIKTTPGHHISKSLSQTAFNPQSTLKMSVSREKDKSKVHKLALKGQSPLHLMHHLDHLVQVKLL